MSLEEYIVILAMSKDLSNVRERYENLLKSNSKTTWV